MVYKYLTTRNLYIERSLKYYLPTLNKRSKENCFVVRHSVTPSFAESIHYFQCVTHGCTLLDGALTKLISSYQAWN